MLTLIISILFISTVAGSSLPSRCNGTYGYPLPNVPGLFKCVPLDTDEVATPSDFNAIYEGYASLINDFTTINNKIHENFSVSSGPIDFPSLTIGSLSRFDIHMTHWWQPCEGFVEQGCIVFGPVCVFLYDLVLQPIKKAKDWGELTTCQSYTSVSPTQSIPPNNVYHVGKNAYVVTLWNDTNVQFVNGMDIILHRPGTNSTSNGIGVRLNSMIDSSAPDMINIYYQTRSIAEVWPPTYYPTSLKKREISAETIEKSGFEVEHQGRKFNIPFSSLTRAGGFSKATLVTPENVQ